ncbi:MAG TPA: hypothetical protein VFV38_19630 [Ktedonobacteraceae bacterium]|nr:hypothetical protein [Ktedonobacteraceae bacterium]
MTDQILVIPPTLHHFFVPRWVLQESRLLLAGPGAQGDEAAVLWLGSALSPTEARVEHAYFPRQIAYRSDDGVAIEIPIEEWTNLALQLPPGQFVLAKLHTHPGAAYHSKTDAANPYLNHEGAVSITLPYFAQLPFDNLERCSVNVLRQGRWIEISPSEVAEAFTIMEDW